MRCLYRIVRKDSAPGVPRKEAYVQQTARPVHLNGFVVSEQNDGRCTECSHDLHGALCLFWKTLGDQSLFFFAWRFVFVTVSTSLQIQVLAGTASWQRQLDQVSRQQFSHLNVLKSFPVNLREHCLFSLFFDRCFIAALFQSLEWSLNVPSCKLQVRPFSSYGSRTRRFRGTRVVEWSGVLFHSEQLFVVWGL